MLPRLVCSVKDACLEAPKGVEVVGWQSSDSVVPLSSASVIDDYDDGWIQCEDYNILC